MASLSLPPLWPVRNGVNIHARHRLTTYGVILSNARRPGKRALVIFRADSRFKAVSTDARYFHVRFALFYVSFAAPTLQMLPVPVSLPLLPSPPLTVPLSLSISIYPLALFFRKANENPFPR